MGDFIGVILRSLEYGSIYALAALSIILVYRTSFTTNFAQGVLGMFNTYLVATLVVGKGLSIYAAIPFGILSAVIIGVLIDVVVIRRAKNMGPVGKQIITLGLINIILGFTPFVFGVYDLQMPKIIPAGSLSFLGASITLNSLFNIVFGLVIMGLLFYLLSKTKFGLAIRTTASNETTARMMGVPTKTITMVSWAIAGVLSMFAGVMASPFSAVSTTFMNDIQISAFMAAVFGGMSTFHGPVIGAYIISIATNVLQVYLPSGTIWGKPIIYILLIIFLYFKPYGIFGKKVVKKV
ncbi:branched-chain amino acid ABC transporter permease [Peptoniphilaceae bacterium SGI.131]